MNQFYKKTHSVKTSSTKVSTWDISKEDKNLFKLNSKMLEHSIYTVWSLLSFKVILPVIGNNSGYGKYDSN